MLSKELIKQEWRKKCSGEKAGLGLATIISGCTHVKQKLRDGSEYIEHPMYVAMLNTNSTKKKIIGFLHDSVEDGEWTLDDLREVGYTEEIVQALDGVTKRPGEQYVEFIERCGMSGALAIDVKLKDLHHNSMGDRSPSVIQTEKQRLKSGMYNISYYYLLDIKKEKIKPGTKLEDYTNNHPVYSKEASGVCDIFNRFSQDRFIQVTGSPKTIYRTDAAAQLN